jgi:hypothetical protein
MSTKAIETLIAGWSDQKLAEVLAFNEDGKMRYMSGCSCIIGVSGSDVLHEQCRLTTPDHHYYKTKDSAKIYSLAETEYARLSEPENTKGYIIHGDDGARARALDVILRAEIARRDEARDAARATQEPACEPVSVTPAR